jgi:hypothetical protein
MSCSVGASTLSRSSGSVLEGRKLNQRSPRPTVTGNDDLAVREAGVTWFGQGIAPQVPALLYDAENEAGLPGGECGLGGNKDDGGTAPSIRVLTPSPLLVCGSAELTDAVRCHRMGAPRRRTAQPER